jgi:hypothetical protein
MPIFKEQWHRHNGLPEVVHFNHQQQESIMSKCTNLSADVWTKDSVDELNPAGSRYSSAAAGIFSLRRARYFNETGYDAAGCGSGIAEVAITEAPTVLD